MAKDIGGFRLEDLRRLYSLLSRVAGNPINDRPRPAVVEDSVYDAGLMAPEVYVVKAGPGGVTASTTYSELFGTGTGSDASLIPGVGMAQVLFLAEDPTFLTDGKFRQIDGYDNLRIYNLSDRDIQAGAWLLAMRIKGGQFIVVAEVEMSDADTGTSTVAAGCHLYYDSFGNLSLNVPSLAGQYLTPGTGTCPVLNVFIPLDCGLDYSTSGALFLNLEEVVGTGLNWVEDDGDGCRLTVKFGCHIYIDDAGRLNVDAESLAGDRGVTGLRKGPITTQIVTGPGGPSLDTELECDTIGNDYEVDHVVQQIVLTDSRLLKIGTYLTQVNIYALNEYRFNLADELIDWAQLSSSLVIKNIDICSFDCDTGTGTATATSTAFCPWYCFSNPELFIDYICGQVCNETDLQALIDAGFVLTGGPYNTQTECKLNCCETTPGWNGEGWYCVYKRPSTGKWYCVTTTFLGYKTCEFLTPDELAELQGVVHSGPHNTYAQCASSCFTGTGPVSEGGTADQACIPVYLFETDRCDHDIEICSGPWPSEAVAAIACEATTGTGTEHRRWYCFTSVFFGTPQCEFLSLTELQEALAVGGTLHSGPHTTYDACATACLTGTGTDTPAYYCITTPFAGETSCEFLTHAELATLVFGGAIVHSGPHASLIDCSAVCHTTGTGGGGGTISTTCCPDNLIPTTLYVTFTGGVGNMSGFAGTITLTYDVGTGTWQAPGAGTDLNPPVEDVTAELECNAIIGWSLLGSYGRAGGGGGSYGDSQAGNGVEVSCNPLHLTFLVTSSEGGSATATITTTP